MRSASLVSLVNDNFLARIDFLAFGYEEHAVTRGPDGAVWNAQLRTGSGLVMIGPGIADFGTRAVPDPAWATSRVHVLVDDLDAHYERAVAAGLVIRTEPGAHFGKVTIYIAGDCGGQQWIFAQPDPDRATTDI